ncbi:hypothetical protein K503DRAFT_404717 [Rhizopogon vinicolor AM-OR11-026]|uniref:Uncharacterized protein n=1 Tax=Rhizopogon vinicolor AM-OR11-026 TaxID=1314800 RepID=A0A1B7MQS3_9AGAM|nr:hypothetical protein K503DRAFT_404717 [Rhizopogon vinicolor AM-OR11-026]
MSMNNIRNTFGAPAPVLPLCTVTTSLEHIRPVLTYITPFPLRSLHYAQAELHEIPASLASHVAKLCALEDMIDEHDTITVEGATFRDLIHASSLRTHHHSGRMYTGDAVAVNQKNTTHPASM